jgi:protein-S-isoprenylcysteine O-methyltransferase Ste14
VETVFAAIRTLFYASGFVFVWGWLAAQARALDVAAGRTLPEALRIPGAALATAGALLALSCLAAFVLRGRGTPALFDPPRAVVASGPYARIRNPMYVGAVALLAGSGLLLRSISVVALAAIAALLAHLLVVLVEEPGLRGRFGAAYEEYCRTAGRWLPKRRPGGG